MMNSEKKSVNAFNGREVNLWDLVRFLLSKFYWILLSGVIAALIVYLVATFIIHPTYESRTSFYVYNTSGSSFNSDTINTNDLQAAESLAESYSQILESNSVLDAVLSNLGNNANLTRKELSEMIEISIVSDTQLIEVVVSSDNAEFACEIADSFVQVAPTEIERITKAGSLEVVDHPEVADEKSAPRTLFDTLVGFLVGAIISVIVILLRRSTDTTIYLPEDVTRVKDVTILGKIPVISTTESKHFNWRLVEGGVIYSDRKKEEK